MTIEKFIPIKDESKIDEAGNPLDAMGTGCEENEPFVLMVLGDSMQPEFNEGEIIVIQPGLAVSDGAYVVAKHNDEYTFRQLIRRDDKWFLHALNENYPTEEFSDLNNIRGVITEKKIPGGGRKNRKKYV